MLIMHKNSKKLGEKQQNNEKSRVFGASKPRSYALKQLSRFYIDLLQKSQDIAVQ